MNDDVPPFPFDDSHQPPLNAESVAYGSLVAGLDQISRKYGASPRLFPHSGAEKIG